jgi:hypothetical protein
LCALCACGDGDKVEMEPGPQDAAPDAQRDADSAADAEVQADAGADAAQVMDAAASDAAASDAAASDAARDASADASADAACVPFVMPTDCVVPENSVLPSELRCTGLYGQFEMRSLACGVLGYTPAYQLWSDGADKHRYVALPAGGTIDASDPNELVFPVGTKFWKEFRSSDGQRLLETRLLQKNSAGWVYTSYVWNESASNAVQQNDGVKNVLGTGHNVPTRDQCDECHRGRQDKILGWDAFLLGAGAEGLTRAELLKLGVFAPGKELASLNIPGSEVERAALGYLHANCGVSCHNANMRAKAAETGLMLRLEAAQLASAATTPAVKTGSFRVPDVNAKFGGISVPDGGAPRDYFRDLLPRDLARSLLLVRMKTRGADGAMPALASDKVDDAGVSAVSTWISQMTADAGYPQTLPDGGI